MANSYAEWLVGKYGGCNSVHVPRSHVLLQKTLAHIQPGKRLQKKKDMNSRVPTPTTKFEWEKQASDNKLKTHQSSGRRLALIMPQALQVTNTTMRPRNGQ